LIKEAISMCPEVPTAYLLLGWIEISDYWYGNTKSPRETIEKGIELAHKVLAMDDSIAEAHALLSALHTIKREFDESIAEGERAVALLPNGAIAQLYYADSLRYAGRSEEAIPVYQKAIRLSPLGWSTLFSNYANALRITGRFEEAVSAYKKALQLSPNSILGHAGLAGTYIMMGREKEARAEAAELLRINPKFSLDSYAKTLHTSFKNPSEIDNYIDALRKAGLK
jgi:adenylate cyclase